MENKKDGGYAFSSSIQYLGEEGGVVTETSRGMSLRDYFASNEDVTQLVLKVLTLNNNFTPDIDEIIELTVSLKYAVADAMLKERENAK